MIRSFKFISCQKMTLICFRGLLRRTCSDLRTNNHFPWNTLKLALKSDKCEPWNNNKLLKNYSQTSSRFKTNITEAKRKLNLWCH